MIVTGKAAEYALLQKLASFTKIPKDEFKKESLFARETHEELPVYSYPVLTERLGTAFDPLFYSITLGGKGSLNLMELLDPVKWAKSELREAFYRGVEYLSHPGQWTRYCLSTQLTGTLWITSFKGRGYATPNSSEYFNGAVVVQDVNGVFVSQPIKNYLIEQLGTVAW